MAFEKASNLLAASFKKYGLTRQVSASLVCQKAKDVICDEYPHMSEYWTPVKFVDGGLSVSVSQAAARSLLFLETNNLLELFRGHEVLQRVRYIKIIN